MVPVLPGVPTFANAVGAGADDDRDVGPGLDVVDAVGLPLDALLDRVGRPLPRLAHRALDGADQGRLLAADERAGAPARSRCRRRSRCRGCPCPSSPSSRAWPQGDDGVLDGQRVLVADVDDALGRADGVRPDEHALDDAVRVALEEAPVHVGAGVALVGVADHELHAVAVALPRRASSHLSPVGKPAPPRPRRPDALTSSMTAAGSPGEQDLLEGGVAVLLEVVVDPDRVDLLVRPPGASASAS